METLARLKPVRGALIWSLVAFVFDGVLTGTVAFSVLTLLVNLLLRTPYNLVYGLLKRQFQTLALTRAAILIVASTVTTVYCLWLEGVAIERAKPVIAAVESYREQNGRFPSTLEQVAPMTTPLKPLLFPPRLDFHSYDDGAGAILRMGPSAMSLFMKYDFNQKRWYRD